MAEPARDVHIEALVITQDDALKGRPYRTLEQIKEELTRAFKGDKMRQLRLAREAISDMLWALEYITEPDDIAKFEAEVVKRSRPLLTLPLYKHEGNEENHGRPEPV